MFVGWFVLSVSQTAEQQSSRQNKQTISQPAAPENRMVMSEKNADNKMTSYFPHFSNRSRARLERHKKDVKMASIRYQASRSKTEQKCQRTSPPSFHRDPRRWHEHQEVELFSSDSLFPNINATTTKESGIILEIQLDINQPKVSLKLSSNNNAVSRSISRYFEKKRRLYNRKNTLHHITSQHTSSAHTW